MMSESELRKIINLTIDELGDKASKETVEAVVTEVLKEYDKGAPSITLASETKKSGELNPTTGRIIITAFGKNKTGIVSGISTILAQHNCDLQDISQKVLQDLFTIIIVVDISKSDIGFMELKNELTNASEKIGVQIFAQHEDIFKAMHRV